MNTQSGVFAFGATEHLFLTFDLTAGADVQEALQILAQAGNPATTDMVNVVVGVRPSLWAEVADAADVPSDVHDYTETKGEGVTAMPAEQHDFWIWISAAGMDACWDWAKQTIIAFGSNAELTSEHRGWGYHGNQDLTGFVDGTENPGRLEAPQHVAIPEGKPGAGASILLFQPYEHTKFNWYETSIEEQEKAIGRTKLENIEFDDDVKPLSAHVARTNIDTDEVEVKVWRRNVAYGDMRRHGTLVVGFTNEQWKLEDMLDRMAGVDGVHDSIMNFMKVTGSAWFVIPSVEGLLKFLPEDDDEE